MVDDYVGYKALLAAGPTELACLAPHSAQVLRRARRQRQPRGRGGAAPHCTAVCHRAASSGHDAGAAAPIARTACLPGLADLHAWLVAPQRTVAAGSGTAKAVEHALKRWPALQRYGSSGSLPIDNNPVENAIRPIGTGKKNGSSRVPSVRAAVPPRSKVCSPPLNSTALTLHAGWPIPSKNSLPAPTAKSTRCYRSQTLHNSTQD
ncbi:hypothetical protein RCH08_005465 [Janthinobacterium sp. CG_S6]|nr:hypothetical protein [Janthinobacterium sp. CG_S6]